MIAGDKFAMLQVTWFTDGDKGRQDICLGDNKISEMSSC